MRLSSVHVCCILAIANLFSWAIAERSFVIDTRSGTFLKDGQQFHYVSGSFHYFRVPQIYWLDRLEKYKAAGLDAIQVYVPWNFHEPKPGNFIFDNDRNLTLLLQLAQQNDLLVIMRPGPYICAEWDFGGLPAWLWNYQDANPEFSIRTDDKMYMYSVNRWWDRLLPIMKPFLYENGGPIIMLQIENEYGSYNTCNANYMAQLVETARQILGDKLIHFTTDGNSMAMVKCGRIPKELEANNNIITVDFGYTNDPAKAFAALNEIQPNKPWINSETYFGWLNHWGEERTMMNQRSIDTMTAIYSFSNRTNLNIYMFHGGTNFGLTNGANSRPYAPQITSYDYGAPLNENGDLTLNYMAVREAIFQMKGLPLPALEVKNVTTIKYPDLMLAKDSHLLKQLPLDFSYTQPPSMEELLFYEQGFVAYSMIVDPSLRAKNITIEFEYGRDNLMFFVSDEFLGNIGLLREVGNNDKDKSFNVKFVYPAKFLHIVVENQGRINYAADMQGDSKGLKKRLKFNGLPYLGQWAVQPLDLVSPITGWPSDDEHERILMRFSGKMNISDTISDTFLTVQSEAKGIVSINGQVLGRFDTKLGPQISLYAPKQYWVQGENEIQVVLTRLDQAVDKIPVTFSQSPIWKGKAQT